MRLFIYLNIFLGILGSWRRALHSLEASRTIHPMTQRRIHKTLILNKAAVIISNLAFVHFLLIVTLRHSGLSQRYGWIFNCHVLLLKMEELSPFEASVTICRVNMTLTSQNAWIFDFFTHSAVDIWRGTGNLFIIQIYFSLRIYIFCNESFNFMINLIFHQNMSDSGRNFKPSCRSLLILCMQ